MAAHTEHFESTVQLDSGLIIPTGAAVGKVLTSDAEGNATWKGTVWKKPIALATTSGFSGGGIEVSGETIKQKISKSQLEIDSVKATVGMRVLLKDQAESQNDGIYEVIKQGSASEFWEIKRTTDSNTPLELKDAVVSVEEGTVNAGLTWEQTATVTTVGTTAQVWVPVGVGAWTTFTLGTKMEEDATTQTVRCRAELGGSVVRLRGSLLVKAGEELKIGETLFTLLVGYRPLKLIDMVIEAGSFTSLHIATTGVATLPAAMATGTKARLDGLTFNLT